MRSTVRLSSDWLKTIEYRAYDSSLLTWYSFWRCFVVFAEKTTTRNQIQKKNMCSLASSLNFTGNPVWRTKKERACSHSRENFVANEICFDC